MRKVELRMNEQEKYEVIKDLVDHNGDKKSTSFEVDTICLILTKVRIDCSMVPTT